MTTECTPASDPPAAQRRLAAWSPLIAAGFFTMFGAADRAVAQPEVSRGELLYRNHCIACHTTQMHWRDGRRATDWASLLLQVNQWQERNRLAWNVEDVEEVTRWLNSTFYRFPPRKREG